MLKVTACQFACSSHALACVIMSAMSSCADRLLQLRVLGLSLFQDPDVGFGVFPEGELRRALLLWEPNLPHQLSKPWVGTYRVEQEISLQTR